MPQPTEQGWNAAEIAAMIGVGERHVKRLAADGVIPKAGRGRYGPEAVAAYCAHLRETAGRGGAEFSKERARLTAAKADVEEMNAAKRRGDLLDRATVDAAMIGAFSRVRSRLLALPTKVAPLVAMDASPATCETIIRQHVNQTLQELAETDVSTLE